jgi:hypothetical protein
VGAGVLFGLAVLQRDAAPLHWLTVASLAIGAAVTLRVAARGSGSGKSDVLVVVLTLLLVVVVTVTIAVSCVLEKGSV